MLCFFKKKTAYEVRISDWSSDVCSSDLIAPRKCRLCDYNFMMMKYLDGEAAIALNGIHGCENRRSYRRPVRTLRQVEGAAHLVRDRARVKHAAIELFQPRPRARGKGVSLFDRRQQAALPDPQAEIGRAHV